jgi:hypothetical protein
MPAIRPQCGPELIKELTRFNLNEVHRVVNGFDVHSRVWPNEVVDNLCRLVGRVDLGLFADKRLMVGLHTSDAFVKSCFEHRVTL